jgi:hypothetical protein
MRTFKHLIAGAFGHSSHVLREIHDHRARWAHLPRVLQNTRVAAVLFDVDPYWERHRLPLLFALLAPPPKRKELDVPRRRRRADR